MDTNTIKNELEAKAYAKATPHKVHKLEIKHD